MGQLFLEIDKSTLYNAELIFITNKYNSFDNVNTYYLEPLAEFKTAAFKSNILSAKAIRDWFDSHISYYPNTKLFLINDTSWFKALAKKPKASPTIGTFYKYKEDSSIYLGYVPDIKDILYNEQAQKDLAFVFKNAKNFLEGTYKKPGEGLKQYVNKYYSSSEIDAALKVLLQEKCLACDIETYSLYLDETGVASISFSSTENNAFTFAVEFNRSEEEVSKIYNSLLQFFINYKGKLIFHNGSFDITILVHTLFMRGTKNDKDKYKYMYYGLDTILRDFDDTKLMAYLCYNSCIRPELGLKYLCKEHLGDYALNEVDNIKVYSTDELLTYNGLDTMGTMYVYNNLKHKIIEEDQVDIYENFYKKAVYELIVMQLVGLPLNRENVAYATKVVTNDYESALKAIRELPLIQSFSLELRSEYVKKKNATYKKKKISEEDCLDIKMNPESGTQLKRLLYDFIKLPIIEYTESGAPSTSKETLIKLLECTDNQDVKNVLSEFIKLADVGIIKKNFIANFNRNPDRLYGYFNLGTVVSGRLSATNNLQTIPSKGTKYAGLIKQCFKVPEGYLLIGIDYSSLEDFISALLTKDSNKLKVYMPISIYKVEVDGEVYYLSDDDSLEIDGKLFKPSELIS